jgi:pimeloyl-ACP methyl ester carboxylesterase
MTRLVTSLAAWPPACSTANLRRIGQRASVIGGLICLLSSCSTSVIAQDPPPVPRAEDQRADAKLPRNLELTTKDLVLIHCMYYPGRQDKQTVPVILLHGWEGPRGAGSGQDLAALALSLHKAGHAVAVPDLRGHGRSTIRQVEGNPIETIDRNAMRPADLQAMMLDVEAVRSFLVEQNNAGHLNIDLLCVVGFEMGSVVALNWIQYDWAVPSFPTFKQGQDVKAFVLVSPEQTFKGVPVRNALSSRVVRSELSAMVIYGTDDAASSTGRRIYNSLKRSHRPVPEDREEAEQLQDLFLVELNTSLRGTKLLASQTLNVTDQIRRFIQLRLVNRRDLFPWQDRTRP